MKGFLIVAGLTVAFALASIGWVCLIDTIASSADKYLYGLVRGAVRDELKHEAMKYEANDLSTWNNFAQSVAR